MTEETKISEDEAKLYDRQIRLWGLDAQKRLRSSHILVSGMRGLGCEVVKNLVLAGIKSLKMLDHQNLSEEDGKANFLAPRSKIGENRAAACMERVKQLNPMVEVTYENANIMDKEADFFKDFDIVVVVGLPRNDLIQVNDTCRVQGVKFFAGDVLGFFGYSFTDLVEHEFTEEVKKNANDLVDESGDEPKAKKPKVEDTEETKVVKHSTKYPSLKDSLEVDWCSGLLAKKKKRMDPAFFLLHVLYEFSSREGRNPQKLTREEDLKLLMELKESIEAKFELPNAKIPDELISMLFSELSPVAAIVGGNLAQEVIKTISNKDEPQKNFFLFNPLQSAGVVECIGG